LKRQPIRNGITAGAALGFATYSKGRSKMTRASIAAIALALSVSLAGCNPYDPGQRALGGGLLGAGAGAAIGGIAGGGTGAAIGAGAGGALGAITGAATTPRRY
jgi:hypothetical protein